MAMAAAAAKLLRGGRTSSSNLRPTIERQAPQLGLASLLQRAGSASAPAAGMAAASARGDLLRSGRATSADLLPAIGRRVQQGAFGPLLRRAASSGMPTAAGARRQMTSIGLFKKELSVVKNDALIQIDGPFKPINSHDVLLDLQEKVYKMGWEAQLYRGRGGSLFFLVGGALSMGYGVWSVCSDKEQNKNTLKELKESTEKTEYAVRKLSLAK